MAEKKRKVLLIDEDQDFVQATSPVLEARGLEVLTAKTCEEGLSALKDSIPDVILLDLIMNKRGDGILFARRLRRSAAFAAFSKIPILMLSDLKQQTEISFPSPTKHPYLLPVDEFLEKPVAPEALLERIQALLQASA